MANKVHRLAALRLLRDRLSQLEATRQPRMERGDHAADVDREIAQVALTEVVAALQDQGIETRPLSRLLAGLVALSAGSSAPVMLAPRRTRHRRPDAPLIEASKGRLAAIMEFRQQSGLTRTAAGQWVVRNMPPKLQAQLGAFRRAALDDWLTKWGGRRGAQPGHGRDGYLAMRKILGDHPPSEAQLKKILETLARSLPS